MFTLGPLHLGTLLTINVVRTFILTQQLTEADTVLLHPTNFDALSLEYSETYRETLYDPYFLLGVLVESALDQSVPLDRLMALCNDNRPHRLALAEERFIPTDDGRLIHRCGYCRSFADAQGKLLSEADRNVHIKLLRLRGGPERVELVHGECCAHQQG